jgi:triacylglycerol lipase
MSDSHTAPIVLVHGVLGFSQVTVGSLKIGDYFRNIPDALRNDGHMVPAPPRLNPTGSIAERAQDLKSYLQNQSETRDRKVHIVAHSMGGLDSRYMISKLDMANRILSLTTISTPHHGSPLADIVVAGANPLLNEIMKRLEINTRAAFDLTTGASRKFNDEVHDSPDIAYFSIAGRFEPPHGFGKPRGFWGLTHDIISKREGGNDAVVSVQSATFTERSESWTVLEEWDANHFRVINWGSEIVLSKHELKDQTIVDKYRNLATRVKALVASRTE